MLYTRGAQPFSGHVTLQHLADEHVPLEFLMTKYFIMTNHRYIKQ